MNAKRASRWDKAFYRCPGAWLGNQPGTFGPTGTITIDVKRVIEALIHLRRYFIVTNPRLAEHERDGLILDIQWKGK